MPRQSDLPGEQRREQRAFLVLPENRLAYTAAMQLLEARSGSQTPLVVVTGPSGVGKSHLLRHVVRSVHVRSSASVLHIAASEFAAEWDGAVRQKGMQEFHDAHMNVDCLACEDLQAIRTRPGAQQALVSVIDELLPKGGRVLLSSRRPPGEIPGLSRRLIDRCHGGVCVSIDPPGRPSRIKLLQQFSREQQALLPPDVVELLSDSSWQLPRELSGLVTRLVQSAGCGGSTIDLSLAATLLRQEPERQSGQMSAIASEVARQFGVALRVLRSQSRHAGHVVPRQAAMFLSRELTGAPYAEIGEYYGGRNHSTVVHACQRLRRLLQSDPRVASLVENVRERLPATSACRKPVHRPSTRRRRIG